MAAFNAICADCGDAITHHCASAPAAIQTSNGKVAQMSLGSTKDGRQAYNQDYPADFQVFWQIYPLHRDKRKALKAWRNAIRRGAIADINNGATQYRNDPNRKAEFTKYAEGWLNADGWLDDPLPAKSIPGQRPDPPRPYDPALAEIEIERARRG